MKTIFILTLFLSTFLKTSAADKIIGGHSIDKADFHVALSIKDTNQELQSICGGTIISENWIITAAHCLEDLADTTLYISAGVTNRMDIKNNLTEVKAVITHPNYDSTQIKNDIALLYVEEKQKSFINIDLKLPDDWQHNELTAIGFGNTSSYGVLMSEFLQSVRLKSITLEECINTNPLYSILKLDPSQLCTTSSKGYGKDTCQGDSGGPLLHTDGNQNILVGITSFGIGCAQRNMPGISTFVPYYKDWIQKTISSFTNSSDAVHLADYFCYDKLDPAIEEDQDMGDEYITMFSRQMNVRSTNRSILPSPQKFSAPPVNTCSYSFSNSTYTSKAFLEKTDSSSIFVKEVYQEEKLLMRDFYMNEESFDAICFNENVENFMVTLSQSYNGSYYASINLSPIELSETKKIPENLKRHAHCKYKDSEFNILIDDDDQLYAVLQGQAFNANTTKYFKAKGVSSNQGALKVIFSTKTKQKDQLDHAQITFINNTSTDIFNWQLKCEGLEFKISEAKAQFSQVSPIFGKEIYPGEYILSKDQFTVDAALSFSLSQKEIQCEVNGEIVEIEFQ
jgi:hypothetical protein